MFSSSTQIISCSFSSFLSSKFQMSFLFSPNPNFLSRAATPCRSYSALSVSSSSSSPKVSRERENGVALLWFKHDLRVDDHPGLITASKYRSVVPIYVFDRRILSRLSDETQELILFAIEDLRTSLKAMGSDLMIKFGSAEKIISDLAKEVKATNIIAEEEVEYELCKMMDNVGEILAAAPYVTGNPKILQWQTPFYDIKNLKDLPEFYHDFTKLQLTVTLPVAPQVLPGVETALNWGSLPTFNDVKKFIRAKPCTSKEFWDSITETSAETILQNQSADQGLPLHSLIEQLQSLKSEETNQKRLNDKLARLKNSEKSVFPACNRSSVGGGTDTVLSALAGYLRYSEGTAGNDWREVKLKPNPSDKLKQIPLYQCLLKILEKRGTRERVPAVEQCWKEYTDVVNQCLG